jgi:hypothetical protein
MAESTKQKKLQGREKRNKTNIKEIKNKNTRE